jgi:hypothetical protein
LGGGRDVISAASHGVAAGEPKTSVGKKERLLSLLPLFRNWSAVSFCRRPLHHAFSFEAFRAVDPPLCHAIPGRPAFGVASEFRHSLAICGMLKEFLRRIHP